MENNFVFDREKLQARIKELLVNPESEESLMFWEEEYERCKDPRYFYNNYWTVNGNPVDPISDEQWNLYFEYQAKQRSSWRRRPNTSKVEDSNKLIFKYPQHAFENDH